MKTDLFNVQQCIVPLRKLTSKEGNRIEFAYNPDRDIKDYAVDLPRSFAIRGWDLGQGCASGHDIEHLAGAKFENASGDVVQIVPKDYLEKHHLALMLELIAQEGDKQYKCPMSWFEGDDECYDENVEELIVTVEAEAVQNLYRKLYKPEQAKVWVYAAQRRTLATLFAIQLMLDCGRITKPSEFKLPMFVAEFRDTNTTYESMLRENAQYGRESYDKVALYRHACRILRHEPATTLTELQALLGVTFSNVQKYHPWAQLSESVFGRIGLDNRVAMKQPEKSPKTGKTPYKPNGWIPVSSLRGDDARTLISSAKTCSDRVADVVGSARATEYDDAPANSKPIGFFTEEDLEKVLKAYVTGNVGASDKMLQKAKIEQFAKNAAIREATANVGEVLKAILTGNASFFNRIAKQATPVDKGGKREERLKATA